MSANNNKPWERPWTIEEIVENASNWNLGADVGLLKHLEQFSEDLLRKANATNNNLNDLLQNLTNASLSLDIARNEFLSLSNTQFIESRVYEDDETLPAENEKNDSANEKKQTEDDRLKDMKLAVMTGLEVLDKYFDKIEVPASDSEDETDCPNFVLRPKDPYLDRPLPYIIGSEEWHKKWHVGLAESSSDSETEKVSEKFSDTDSESDLPVVNRQAKSISESGSEADLSNRIQGGGPVANSTFNDTNKHFFGSSSSEEFNSVSAQAPISQNNFAEQLAAKLGNVIAHNVEVPEPEINKRPIQKPSTARDFGNLFPNEPPPLDDTDDDLFGAKSNQHGVFSGGDGLFDDLDNDVSFWGQKKDVAKQEPQVQAKAMPNLFDEEDDAIFTSGTLAQPKQATAGREEEKRVYDERKPRGLFDDGDASDDDIFNTNALKKKLETMTQQHLQPQGEEPPPLTINKKNNGKKKVPIGGVSVLARDEIRKALKNRQYSSESSDSEKQNTRDTMSSSALEGQKENKSGGEDLFTAAAVSANKTPETKPDINEDILPKKKNVGLFDQDDELFDDLFTSVPQKKFSSGLFDDADDFTASESKPKLNSHSLFDDFIDDADDASSKKNDSHQRNTVKKVAAHNETKPIRLFDDDASDDDFLNVSVQTGKKKHFEPELFSNDDIFSSKETEKLKRNEEESNQQKPKPNQNVSTKPDNEELVLKKNGNKTRQILSLFDDDGEEEDDDLFLITSKTSKQKSKKSDSPFKQNENVFKSDSLGNDEDLFKNLNKSSTFKSPEAKENVLKPNETPKQASADEGSETKTLNQFKTPSSSGLFEDSQKSVTVEADDTKIVNSESEQDFKQDENVSSLTNDSKLLENNLLKQTQNGNAAVEKEEGSKDLFPSQPFVEKDFFEAAINAPVVQIESQPETQKADLSGHSQASIINLFDPTPPPDLENWDTRSETNLFEDDVYSFDNGPSVSEQRSSIFDVEPPSLLYNESSGIVRDQSARIETDESSFFPYASSSRRLSTDLSHEEDSIFITKTKNAIDPNLLQDIPEASPQASAESFTSAIDITPSGNVDDLYSEITTFANNSELAASKEKLDEQSNVSASVKEVISKNNEENASLVKEKLDKKPPVPKIKPQVDEELSKDDTTKEGKEEKPKDGGPGKLKHNLNINVRALLPGAVLARRNLEKSRSLDLSQDLERKIDAEGLGIISNDLFKNSKSAEASYSDSNLHNPEGSVEVLQSITKDRVRIPIRRRPSTKKGREAIRKSCIDFSVPDPATEVEEESKSDKIGNVIPSFLAELNKKLTSNEDYKPTDHIDVVTKEVETMDTLSKATGDNKQHNVPVIIMSEPENVQPDLDDKKDYKNLLIPDEEEVFGGARRTSFVKTDNFESPDFKKSDLFDDDGDDIFSAKKLPPKSDIFKRSLFEDDDDDTEDIFGTSATVTAKVSGESKSSIGRRPKSSILKKLENTEVIFDPLDALKK